MQELGAGGAKNVEKPTAAGQIPIASTKNGRLVYSPSINPIPVPTLADVGKAPVVSSFDPTTNAPIYTYTQIIPEDEASKSLYNQNGIIGRPTATISADKKNLIITPFSAVFYDSVLQTRAFVTLANPSTVPVNATASQQVTYIYVKPDGTFGLDYVLALDKVYVFEVITDVTTPFNIISFRPIYVIYDNVQATVKANGEAIGREASDFALTYSVTTNRIAQSSTTAKLTGYNINPGAANASILPFPVSTAITFDYWAFTVANRVPTTQIVVRQYKIDNPNTSTSTNITGNNFGIVLIYVGINGTYKLLAPQQSYTSEAIARQSVITYAASARVPKDIAELYSPVGAIYVPANVTNATALNIDIISGIGLGGAPLQDSAVLPAPITDGPVIAQNGAYIIGTSTPTPSIDTTGAISGQYLGINGQNLEFINKSVVLPSKYFAEQKVDALKIGNDNTVIAAGYTGGDFTGLGLTFAVAVVDAATKKNSITFNGNPKLLITGGLGEGNAGQFKFEVLPPNVIYYIADNFNPETGNPVNPTNKPCLDFSIYFLVGE